MKKQYKDAVMIVLESLDEGTIEADTAHQLVSEIIETIVAEKSGRDGKDPLFLGQHGGVGVGGCTGRVAPAQNPMTTTAGEMLDG